jgi:hypothetical protein
MTRVLGLVCALLIVCTAGCDESPTSPSPDLRGGVLLGFRVVGQPFAVWATNPRTIEQAFALSRSGGRSRIPVGRILRGAGQGNHNAPYSWHLDPDDIQLAEAAIEVCDGTPSFVEANVHYFVNDVKAYCPWAAELVRIDDYR